MGARIAYRPNLQAGTTGYARTRKVIGGGNVIIGGTTGNANDVLVIGQQTAIFRVPKDFVVTGWFGPNLPKLDTGALLTFNLGDNGNALQAANLTRYLSASAVCQAGGAVPAFPAGALYFQYLMDTDMIFSVQVAAAGAQPSPGSFTLYLDGFLAP